MTALKSGFQQGGGNQVLCSENNQTSGFFSFVDQQTLQHVVNITNSSSLKLSAEAVCINKRTMNSVQLPPKMLLEKAHHTTFN